jgi:hypothetical protein
MNVTVIFPSVPAKTGAQKNGVASSSAVAKSHCAAHRRITGAVSQNNLFVQQDSTSAAYTGGRRNAIAAWRHCPAGRARGNCPFLTPRFWARRRAFQLSVSDASGEGLRIQDAVVRTDSKSRRQKPVVAGRQKIPEMEASETGSYL